MASRLKKKEKKRRSPLVSLLRGLYGFVVVLAVLVVVGWCAVKLISKPPDLTAADPAPAAETAAAPGASADPAAANGLTRREGVYNILLAAEDQVSGSADTIMMCSYDTKNQTVGLVSVPRDTLVDRPGWGYHKINAAFSNGNFYYPPDGGLQELKTAVSEVLGVPIDRYVLVNTKIFPDIVNALDGIDFNVPVHMSYDAPDQNLHIHYEPGMQHLTGKQALEVARCRENSDGKGSYPHNIYDAYPDADIGRTRTQQEMLQVIVKKALSNPQKIGEYADLMVENVKTDLTAANFLWFGEQALQFDFDDLETATLPGDGTVDFGDYTDCYALDVAESLDIINRLIDPYTTPITEDMVQMSQGPGTGK